MVELTLLALFGLVCFIVGGYLVYRQLVDDSIAIIGAITDTQEETDSENRD